VAEPFARQGPVAAWPPWVSLLYEPPNVAGWHLGVNWFSTGTMLARANFAATVAASQKDFLAASLAPDVNSADGLLATMLDRVTPSAVRLRDHSRR
jgi:hypothetical protein